LPGFRQRKAGPVFAVSLGMNTQPSKIQQAWHLLLQGLCPTRIVRRCLASALALLLPIGSWAAGTVNWPAAATPELALNQAVSQWLGAQQGIDPSGIRLGSLDPRLQIKPCTSGLQLDFPFVRQETVRVRCEAPTWQLFMRVLNPPASQARTPPPAPTFQARPPAAPQVKPAAAPDPKPAAVRKVVIATGLLHRGTRVGAEQVSLVEWSAPQLPANALDRIEDAVNAELIRDIPAGSVLRSHDIRPALMVKKGQLVMVTAGAKTGFNVLARLEALQDGRMGEQIKLKNRESGRQISAVVTGMNTADAL
jgi:flagella basal body P-ring formation protein FlgA